MDGSACVTYTFGSKPTDDQFQRVTRYTISMATSLITELATCSLSRQPSINVYMADVCYVMGSGGSHVSYVVKPNS